MNTRNHSLQALNQQLHLCPIAAPCPGDSRPPPLVLANEPAHVTGPPLTYTVKPAARTEIPPQAAVVEPFLNAASQLRLLILFPTTTNPKVNGDRVPRRFVLAPGDQVQWLPGAGFRVALFHKPQVGPPTASARGKLCPVCRAPLASDATCVTCPCGVSLHCDPDEQGLQCAQLRQECPVCKRPIRLTEGYISHPSDEES